MRKISVALFVLTLVNTLALIQKGFDWLTAVAVALALICFALNLFEGRKVK